MKQNKLDKAFKGAEKSMNDSQTLCGEIQEKLMDIREKLAVYAERRRWRHVQWLNDRNPWNAPAMNLSFSQRV